MVQFAPGDGSFAAVGCAGLMCSRDGDAVGLGEESFGSSEVEGHGCAAEDHGDDSCVAGQASGFSGGEQGPGVDSSCLQLVDERCVVDVDHNCCCGGGVEVVGG